MFYKNKKFAAFFAGTIVMFSNYSQTVFGMNEKEHSISDDINNLSRISLDSEECKNLFTTTERSNTISNILLGTENLSDNKNDNTENSSEHFNEDLSRFSLTSTECKELFGEASLNSNNNTTDNTVDNNNTSVAICSDENIKIAAENYGKSCQCLRFCCKKLGRSIKKHPYIWCAGGAVSIGAGIFIADLYTNHALINAISGLF